MPPVVSTIPARRMTVTCGLCGHEMKLARKVTPGERIELVCHSCEASLAVQWETVVWSRAE